MGYCRNPLVFLMPFCGEGTFSFPDQNQETRSLLSCVRGFQLTELRKRRRQELGWISLPVITSDDCVDSPFHRAEIVWEP